MRKKFMAVILSAALAIGCIGCGSDSGSSSSGSSGESKTASESSSAASAAAESSSAESSSAEEPEIKQVDENTAIQALIDNTNGTVTLRVWASESDQEFTQKRLEAFKEKYNQVKFDIQLGSCSEADAKDSVLQDVTAAPDVFTFADDQLIDLIKGKALQEVQVTYTYNVNESNLPGAVSAASYNGKLYAYPMTADNGYFMYYDSRVFTKDDVKSLDKMIEAAKKANKQIAMNLNSGWYLYSFFKGAGLDAKLGEDGKANVCNWNTGVGPAVAQAIIDYCKDGTFISVVDDDLKTGVLEGKYAAAVSGTWNSAAFQEAMGEGYAACKLPTFTADGKEYQMGSFGGCKLVGVNPYSEYIGWSMMLAEFLTNEESQTLRFKERALGPSNAKAFQAEEVQSNAAIVAVTEQSEFATPQIIGNNFWSPSETLGKIFGMGNPDGTAVQTLLDNAVEGITAAEN